MPEKSNTEIIEQLERLHFLLEEALKCDEYIKTGSSISAFDNQRHCGAACDSTVGKSTPVCGSLQAQNYQHSCAGETPR